MLADAPLAYIDTLDRTLARGLADYRNRLAGWAAESGSAQFIAEEGDRFIGHLGVFDHLGSTGLVAVYVSPDRRGQGVLGRLVDAAAAWARSADRPRLLLSVMERNHRAIRAYAKLGFVDTGNRSPHPYLPVFTEIEMSRPA
jgi:GNAT superfamily N-acetyltransferase